MTLTQCGSLASLDENMHVLDTWNHLNCQDVSDFLSGGISLWDFIGILPVSLNLAFGLGLVAGIETQALALWNGISPSF